MASLKNQETMGLRLPTAAGATLALWFILLAFGGGCLAWYYSSIEYFPDIAWEEALSFLGVLSIIGGSLVVAFCLLAFLPGVIWSEVLLADCQLRGPLRYRRADGKEEPCFVSIATIIGFPFALFILAYHFLIAFHCKGSETPSSRSIATIGLEILEVLLIATIIFMLLLKRALEKWREKHAAEIQLTRRRPSTHRSASLHPTEACLSGPSQTSAMTDDPQESSNAKYAVAFGGSALLSLTALMILEPLLGFNCRELRTIALAFLCAGVTVFANIIVAMLFGTWRLAAILVAGLATILLLVVGEWVEGPTSLLHKVMKSYGVGEGTRYVLIVTKEGGDLLAEQGLPVEVGGKRGLVKISDIAILSRLGENFLVCKGREKVSLRKWMVVSWAALASDEFQVCDLRPAPSKAGGAPPPAPAKIGRAGGAAGASGRR
jgi:hypothetical protein